MEFIDSIVNTDTTDKDFQKKVIDNFVWQEFVSENNVAVYFNLRGGPKMETVTFEESKVTVSNYVSIQRSTSMARVVGFEPTQSRSQNPLPYRLAIPHQRKKV